MDPRIFKPQGFLGEWEGGLGTPEWQWDLRRTLPRELTGKLLWYHLLPPPSCHECRCDGRSLTSHLITMRGRPIIEKTNRTHRALRPHIMEPQSLCWQHPPLASLLCEKNNSICINTAIKFSVICSQKHSSEKLSKEWLIPPIWKKKKTGPQIRWQKGIRQYSTNTLG